jgi:hypothetical protein
MPTPRDGSQVEGGKTDVSGHADTAKRHLGETSENYPGVVAVLDGGRSRVIICSSGIQWIVQHRQGATSWRSRSHCRTQEALIRCCGGSTPELDALPDRIGDRVAPADMQVAAE